jgi:hypothetical protein
MAHIARTRQAGFARARKIKFETAVLCGFIAHDLRRHGDPAALSACPGKRNMPTGIRRAGSGAQCPEKRR